MSYVCYNKIGFVNHPFVAAGDGKSWRNVFKSGVNDTVVQIGLGIDGNVWRYVDQLCVWMVGLIFFAASGGEAVEISISAKVKRGVGVADFFGEKREYFFFVVCGAFVVGMTAKGNYHKNPQNKKVRTTEAVRTEKRKPRLSPNKPN